MKKVMTISTIAALCGSALGIEQAVIDHAKDRFVDNDAIVCLNDVLYEKGQSEKSCDDVDERDIDVRIMSPGKITIPRSDTTGHYDLFIRINNRGYCESNVNHLGVDDEPNETNEAVINSMNNANFGINIYKDNGLTISEFNSLGSEIFCLPSQITSVNRPTQELSRTNNGFGYTLDKPGTVTLEVYDAKSRLVRTVENEHSSKGDYTMALPKDLSSGIYFARFRFDGKELVDRFHIIE